MASGKELTTGEIVIPQPFIVNLLVAGARLLRKVDWDGIVGNVRRRASRGYFQSLHLEVIHSLRRVAILTCEGRAEVRELTTARMAFCTAFQHMMAEMLEVQQNELHCCLKVLERGRNRRTDRIRTIARSEPLDGRATHEETAHLVGDNTVWSALLGGNDGFQDWRPVNCFCCNDLKKHSGSFRNTRSEWYKYYRSALVFPLRYMDSSNPEKFDTVAFLALDSVRPGIFKEMPDVFDSVDTDSNRGTSWTHYHDLLSTSAPFHAGALVADILSIALRPHYEKQKRTKGQNA